MSDTSTYNGFKNRETLVANLWLSNDQRCYNMLQRALKLPETKYRKATWLETLVNREVQTLHLDIGLYSELLSTALSNVSWLEIIEAHLE
jgi:hypothetical protein